MKMSASTASLLPSRLLSVPEKDMLLGMPLPELFGSQLLDMPLLQGGGEFVLEDLGSDTASQGGTVVEEILDFFVDPSNPSKLLMSRSGAGAASFCSLPMSAASSQSISSSRSLSACAPAAPVVRKRPLQPCEDEKVSLKRERNRLAAERCRARRVQLISALQAECDDLRVERDRLQRENKMLLDMLAKSGIRLPPDASSLHLWH